MNSTILVQPFWWIIRRLGVRTLQSLTLLLTVLISVTMGLADSVRGLDYRLLWSIAVSGTLAGWILARLPLRGWLGGILGFALGIVATSVQVGKLGHPLMILWRSLFSRREPNGLPTTLALTELETAVNTLLTQVRDWLLALAGDQAAFDPVAAALMWSLALWMVAVWAGWSVRRRGRPLQGILPAGVLLTTGLAYTGHNPNSLLPFLGATWLLMALTRHNDRERHWEAAGIDYPPGIRLELAMTAIVLSLALVAMAVLAPSVSVRPVVRFAQRLMLEHLGDGSQLADSLGLEQISGQGIPLEQARAAGLPRRHLLGSGPELSEQVVMSVSTGEMPPSLQEAESRPAPPSYYWRSLTYDHYTGHGWRTGETTTVAYRAGERVDRGNTALESAESSTQNVTATVTLNRTLRQEVQAIEDLGGLLYAAGTLVAADHDYRVAWRSPGDAFGAEIEAQAYRVDALLPIVSEAQLRAAGRDYPQWVRDRYLTLAPEVPERILSLAHDLTASESNPYDQARAIETYLRTFTYTLDLPAPPPNRDVVDYFLFDLQRGYCDYYATAMAVLARAAGLPARLVTGYASGTYDPRSARYIVTAADAHSWPEVFFPGYGWVEFEPTQGRPAIEHPETLPSLETTHPPTPLEPVIDKHIEPRQLVWLGVLGGLVTVWLARLIWWLTDGRRLWRLPPAAAVAALYQRLHRHGRRLAAPARVGDTPHEFAMGLTQRVTELAHERGSDAALPLISQQVHWLTDLYVRGRYGAHEPDAREKARAIQTWGRLRRYLWRAWVWRKMRGKRRAK